MRVVVTFFVRVEKVSKVKNVDFVPILSPTDISMESNAVLVFLGTPRVGVV